MKAGFFSANELICLVPLFFLFSLSWRLRLVIFCSLCPQRDVHLPTFSFITQWLEIERGWPVWRFLERNRLLGFISDKNVKIVFVCCWCQVTFTLTFSTLKDFLLISCSELSDLGLSGSLGYQLSNLKSVTHLWGPYSKHAFLSTSFIANCTLITLTDRCEFFCHSIVI